MITREDYLAMRLQYEPASLRLVIVAESPPSSGRYFYNPTGRISEPLFAALMRQLGVSPSTKHHGLTEFQLSGWLLVDATYEPVNERDAKSRDAIIERDYPLLRADLQSIDARSRPIILIKQNVCRLLEARLLKDGFNVLNRGHVVYFPSTGRQADFHRQFSEILKSVRFRN